MDITSSRTSKLIDEDVYIEVLVAHFNLDELHQLNLFQDKWIGQCPLCKSKGNKFTISKSKKFSCKECCFSGDATKFVKNYLALPTQEKSIGVIMEPMWEHLKKERVAEVYKKQFSPFRAAKDIVSSMTTSANDTKIN